MLLLGACTGWNSVGVNPDRLPTNVEDSCPHPFEVIQTVTGSSVGSDELRMGRLGDALLECGAEKDIAVEAYNGVREALNPELDTDPSQK